MSTQSERWGALQPHAGKSLGIVGRGILILLLAACSVRPRTVDRVTIVNRTAYKLDVQVTDGDRDGWLPVAIVDGGSDADSLGLVDQGDVWIFRFLHSGDPVGELILTRAELERNDWQVEVPGDVEDRLRALGRAPSE
jgi:hypothetical protein